MRVFRVGGSVRDELLGLPVADSDFVVVGATPEEMVRRGFTPVGKDFPVFLHAQTRDEYALARTERKSGRGYRGFAFHATPEVTLEEDLRRRDLTINAMAQDEQGRLIDPHGGERDLRAGILRHVSVAFSEDPLRVLRVARFAARFGFSVAPETQSLMSQIVASGELTELAPERIWQELAKGLMTNRPSRMIVLLRECGALAQLLPEVDLSFERPDNSEEFAGRTMADHMVCALDFAARQNYSLTVRFAIMGCLALSEAPVSGPDSPQNRLAERLRVPTDFAALAVLAAREQRKVNDACALSAEELIDLLRAADAWRRPQRLTELIQVAQSVKTCASDASDYPPAECLCAAFKVARMVDNAAIAAAQPGSNRVGEFIRSAQIEAVRSWQQSRMQQKTRPG